MKTQPVQIWKNGSLKEAAWLNCYVISDNLKDSATFYYSLSTLVENEGVESAGDVLADGNLSMTGEAYEGWQTNEYAWSWIAQSLGLTIINE